MDDFMDLNGALSLIIGEWCCTGSGFLQVDHMEYNFTFFVIAGAAMLFSGFRKRALDLEQVLPVQRF